MSENAHVISEAEEEKRSRKAFAWLVSKAKKKGALISVTIKNKNGLQHTNKNPKS